MEPVATSRYGSVSSALIASSVSNLIALTALGSTETQRGGNHKAPRAILVSVGSDWNPVIARAFSFLRHLTIRAVREVLMRYKPKNIAALHIALAGLPDKMRVEVDPDLRMSAKTVAELRNVTAWPENLVIATPQERYPENAVRVSKPTLATRISPKQ